MTLYEFNILKKEDKLTTVWKLGTFVDNYISNIEMCSLYAIDRFFVEIVMHPETYNVIKMNSFITGHLLDKYSSLK